MEKNKRLFLFAAFDSKNIHHGVIDDPLVIFLRELSTLGDVVFFMDNDVADSELEKITPLVLFAGAARHGEYDFGSYKRGYLWVRDNNLLDNYDWAYFVNDSVYAPFYPLRPIIETLESKTADATGMVFNARKRNPHIQSWFFGTSKKLFMSDYFDSFITSVVKHSNKRAVYQYEDGFTELCKQNSVQISAAYYVRNREIYNNVKGLFCKGLPFMKKKVFRRRYGALGRQVLYVLNHISPELSSAIIKHAQYLYGEDYVNRFLTDNILKIMCRYIRYAGYKLFKIKNTSLPNTPQVQ